MKGFFCGSVFFVLLLTLPASAYQPLKDDSAGGNPKLDKKVYKVYIQKGPDKSGYEDDAKEAIDQWKKALADKGVDLQVQDGAPPQDPVDLKKYNDEVEKFNKDKDPVPDMTKYPEITKYNAKKCTISVYFEKKEDISKRGGGAETGLASNFWNFDGNGHADKIEVSDVFLPTDPPGGSDEIKKKNVQNVALHEFGHVAGMDHYTEAQKKDGKVMEEDATLHDSKLKLGPEETKGVNAIYGAVPQLKIEEKAEKKDSSFLPDFIRPHIPVDLPQVWEYTYDVAWLSGSEINYFQVEANNAPVFFAFGSEGLEDWLVKGQGGRYLDFYADSHYLGDNVFSGRLQFYSDVAPGEGWLIGSGSAERGVAPVPEPLSVGLFSTGFLGMLLRRRDWPAHL